MADLEITESPRMFGALVIKASTSIGWGGNGGNCQLTLIEDPKAKDADGNLDPAIIDLPEVGTACYFNFHEFQFGGVFQRYSYKQSVSGYTYDIILEAPAKLLDGVQVILDEFEGTGYNINNVGFGDYDMWFPGGDPKSSPVDEPNPTFTNQLNNIWNPFAHRENYFYGGIWGGANVNNTGFPAPDLLELIQLISEGGSEFGGPATFGDSEYKLDVSDLQTIMADNAGDFRLKGPTQSVNSILGECVALLVMDYFVTVTGKTEVEDASGNTEDKDIAELGNGGGVIDDPVIKIKLIDKSRQPMPGAIEAFVAEHKAGGRMISADTGEEFSDNVTQKLVVGGDATRYYEISIDNVLPIWGKVGNGWQLGSLPVPLAYLPGAHVPVNVPGGGYHSATVFELRMAMASMQEWTTFKVMESIARGSFYRDPWCAATAADPSVLLAVANGNFGALTLTDTSARTANIAYQKPINDLVQRIYNGVKAVADGFYGKMFFVPLPYEAGGQANNLRWIKEEYQQEATWDISESAYNENFPVADVSFYDGDGRLKSTAIWAAGSDFSELGGDHAYYESPNAGGLASTKGGPEKDVWWINGAPYVVFDAGAQIKLYDGITTSDFGLTVLAKYFFNINLPPASYITPGKTETQISVPPAIVPPAYLGIPQQSNRYKWGPWYAYGKLPDDDPDDPNGKKGKAEVLFEEDALRPEVYGSSAIMDQAAWALASAGTSAMFAAESGSVTLVGVPEYNIADRMADAGPYVTNIDVNIGIEGLTTTYKFNTWTPQYGKLAKYNIDRISRINKASMAMMQSERGRMQKRPYPKMKFVKSDFRTLQQRHADYVSHSWMATLFKGFKDFDAGGGGRGGAGGGGDGGAGGILGDNDNNDNNDDNNNDNGDESGNTPRPETTYTPLAEAGPLANANYSEMFGCSLEQIFSPVSIGRAGGASLPGFEGPTVAGEQGPFGGALVGPSSQELDPYFPDIFDPDPETGLPRDDGRDFFAKVDYTAVINSAASDLNISKLNRNAVTGVRTKGLRGPLILSGWGYDIADQSVPRAGGFGPFEFLSSTPSNRASWKTGPIHLMWDDERKVWAGGLQMVCGTLASPITKGNVKKPTTFTVNVLRRASDGKGAEFQQGKKGLKETITCYNRDSSLVAKSTNQKTLDETWVIAVKLNYEWMALWVGCPTTKKDDEEDDDSGSGGESPGENEGGDAGIPPGDEGGDSGGDAGGDSGGDAGSGDDDAGAGAGGGGLGY